MDQYVRCQHLKEEEFLESYYETVDAVLPRLGHECRPNYQCNDEVRCRRDWLLAAGQLGELTFDSAVLFYNSEGFSSIRLYLRSSARLLIARIRWITHEMEFEILADVPTKDHRRRLPL